MTRKNVVGAPQVYMAVYNEQKMEDTVIAILP